MDGMVGASLLAMGRFATARNQTVSNNTECPPIFLCNLRDLYAKRFGLANP